MFNSPHLIYCNCASVPVLHSPNVYSVWNCPIQASPSVYGTSLDRTATHGGSSEQTENSETNSSSSRNLKFGIENILYGKLQSDQPVIHRPFLSNHELAYIHHQPFSSPMRTSSRPWCRPVFTQLQRRGLEKRFQVTKYVTKRERLQIGAMLGLSETQVKVWFQNRRTKWRHEAARKEEKLKEKSLKKVEESQQEEEETTIESDETEEITEECSSEVSVKEY